MNSWGEKFRITLWGESHGQQVGVSIDGVPAGIALSEDDFSTDLNRRKSGAAGTTPRHESDTPRIVSGIYNGYTTGSPLTIEFNNENTRSGDYKSLETHPRPSHADLVARQKWNGYNDPRGGGHFSGRITLALVAAGVVAKKILGTQTTFQTDIIAIGGSHNKEDFAKIIEQAQQAQNSVGGVVECRINGIQAGVGEPFFDSVESQIAHLLFAVPAVKGVEFGAGFKAADMKGSEHNDPICDAQGHTATNHAGGIVGGISNGNEIVVRAAIKPTASISMAQQTFNFESGSIEPLVIKGRHDVCITLRAAVVIEAAAAIALADLSLRA
ncbi:MAG: chorismate synthase [Rikenellaceae bacterium]|nr:chorismate synthase [Rikenellaceae bacterium]